MGQSLAAAIAWAENIDEYEDLATKPDPSEGDLRRLRRCKARLILGIESEAACWPEPGRTRRWCSMWRSWLGEEPLSRESGMLWARAAIAERSSDPLDQLESALASVRFETLNKLAPRP